MNKYYLKTSGFEAMRLNVDNLEEVEAWCHGSIRGTLLPAKDRIIRVQSGQGEIEAQVYEWIVKLTESHFIVLSDSSMRSLFHTEQKKWRPLLRLPSWYTGETAAEWIGSPEDPSIIDVIATPVS